jgi:hypothetical protein
MIDLCYRNAIVHGLDVGTFAAVDPDGYDYRWVRLTGAGDLDPTDAAG